MNVDGALARACELARRGLGDVEPNPPVGAVLLQGEQVVGEGWHTGWGAPHAEVEALARAGPRARGATLCVTLEPCSSVGKTPACTKALLDAGVARVVVGAADPDPRHQGHGLSALLAAGVAVDLRESAEAAELIERFERELPARRPHVLAKWAMSRDGAIAPGAGRRATLSCPESLALLHRWRAHVDALVVGVNTVEVDDPLLTARGDVPARRPLHRVVLDPSLRISRHSRLVADASSAPTWVAAADDAPTAAEDALASEGVSVLRVPRGEGWLAGVFAALRLAGLRRVMVEGGSHTLASCLAADLVDQVAIFMTPAELGRGALPAVRGLSLGRLSPHEVATALHLVQCRVSGSGADTLLRGFRS